MQSPPSLNLLSPRQTLAGAPGTALGGVLVDELPDGSLCVVPGSGLYQLDKFSSAAVASPNIVATGRGVGAVGRWVLLQAASGTFEPLSTTVFVDAGTSTPLSLQDGSIARPFSTVQAAINATSAIAMVEISISPGTYAESPSVNIDNDRRVIFTAPGTFRSTTITGTITTTSNNSGGGLVVENITFDVLHFAGTAHNEAILKNCSLSSVTEDVTAISNLVMCGDFPSYINGSTSVGDNSSEVSTIDLPLGNVFLSGTMVNTSCIAATLFTEGVQFRANSGTVIDIRSAGNGQFESRNTSFRNNNGSITILGTGPGTQWRLDGITNAAIKAMTETLTNVTKLIIDDLTP